MSRRAKIFMLILLAVLAIGVSYLHVLTRRVVFQLPPEQGEEVARTRLSEAALQSATRPHQMATLYFPSFEQGVLREEKRSVAWAEAETDRIRQVLLALIEGSHQGYSRSLPTSTEIRAVFLAPDGTAFLDFSNQAMPDINPGIASECLVVYSVVDSLAANIPAVKKVKILVQGQDVDTLNGHADLSDYFVPDPVRISLAP
jgi:spore germination protein GerM